MTTVKVKFRPSTVEGRPGTYRLFCNSPPCRQANHNRL